MNAWDNQYMRPAEETHECGYCSKEIPLDELFCSKDCAKADENE